MKRMLCLLALNLTTPAADAGLYKCIAADGHVTYRDTPCASASRPLTVDPLPPTNVEGGDPAG